MIWALLMIAVMVLILVFNNDKMTLELGFASIRAMKSIILLAFTSCGVFIGMLLR